MYKTNRSFKPYLRNEFGRQCVYCRKPDGFDPSGFGVDHYKPKEHFRLLEFDYSNLFYCCNRCNSFKSDYWDDQIRIPNPCDDIMFEHLGYKGEVVEVRRNSKRGERAVEILDLNGPEATEVRGSMHALVAAAEVQLKELGWQRSEALSESWDIVDIDSIDEQVYKLETSLELLCATVG